jgi:hypothetical protein
VRVELDLQQLTAEFGLWVTTAGGKPTPASNAPAKPALIVNQHYDSSIVGRNDRKKRA